MAKNDRNLSSKPLLWGLALIALIVACIVIGPYLGLSMLAGGLIGGGIAVALLIGGLAYNKSRPVSRKITPKLLEKLSKQSEEKQDKLIADLSYAMMMQWFKNPKLFKRNFKVLQEQNPELIAKIGAPSGLPNSVNIPKGDLLFILIASFEQSEALPFTMDIIRAKLKDMSPDSIEYHVLIYIQQSVLESHELLAQTLISEWPNANLNYIDFQRNHTLLMRLIENNATENQLKIFLNLKNKDGQKLVDPDCLAGGNLKKTALEVALRQNPPNVKLANVLKEYGAENYGTLSPKEIRAAFEEAEKRRQLHIPPSVARKMAARRQPAHTTTKSATSAATTTTKAEASSSQKPKGTPS